MACNHIDEALLEMLSIYRHEFLNYLQVIGGLVQLNKTDRLLDYIRKASEEVQQLARLTTCGDPRVALLIFNYFCRWETKGILLLELRGTIPLLTEPMLDTMQNIFLWYQKQLRTLDEYTATLILSAGDTPYLQLNIINDKETVLPAPPREITECGGAISCFKPHENGFTVLLDKTEVVSEK
jgi:hypothetical protein